jgi:lipoprotein-anchoring transpeptidase ErfK/SrfK
MKDITIGRRALLGLAGLGAAEALLTACGSGTNAQWNGAGASPGGSAPAGSAPPTSAAPTGAPVHVRLYERDGGTYGVGMPIIAYLTAQIANSQAFSNATKVTVNGTAAQGAWYFQKSAIYSDYPVEAHYRLADYWPAHAQIRMDLPVKGLPGGPGFVFDNSLTLDISTGPRNVSMIDGHAERMVVTSDNNQVFSFPVSLGKATAPTFSGVKVVMEKDEVKEMISTDPNDPWDLKVPWSVRVTNSGEFIHSASWNGGNIGVRSTSHGCTNLTVADAQKFFAFAQIGDVAVYTNTGGSTMPSWDGYGDWNLDWSSWQAGGLISPTA